MRCSNVLPTDAHLDNRGEKKESSTVLIGFQALLRFPPCIFGLPHRLKRWDYLHTGGIIIIESGGQGKNRNKVLPPKRARSSESALRRSVLGKCPIHTAASCGTFIYIFFFSLVFEAGTLEFLGMRNSGAKHILQTPVPATTR